MEAEDQNFILNFGEDTGEAYEVKSLQDTSSREGLTEILGNYWDSHFVFQDFSVASVIFSEFYKTKKYPTRY
ncbi:MAG: hypothetical protein HC852_22850 [Acaryochloridaceae cyanobacterium RU_4_10]|nr:hypothetical protein [Acaryochloridaceae cyanobacterium RU_4_10]